MAKNVTGKRVNLVIPACKFWQIVSQLSRMQTISFYFAIHFARQQKLLQLIIDFGSDLTWRQIDVRFQVRLSRKKIFI